MLNVVVVGSTNMDLTFRLPRLPQPGETIATDVVDVGFGGKGANQAVLAARMGAKVTFISAVGDDDAGRRCLENLRSQGVKTNFVRVVPGPTGTAAILVDQSAQNAIAVAVGANASVTQEVVRDAAKVIAKADVVVAQLETPVIAAVEAFRLARAAKVRTVLNPAPATEVIGELLSLTDIVVPNESEFELLTEKKVANDTQLLAAAMTLQKRGPGAVLLTRGDRGAFLWDGAAWFIPPHEVQAVDPTAAGDAFVGALAVGLASGQALHKAARRACIVAALTVTKAGAQASYPSRQEIESALAEEPL